MTSATELATNNKRPHLRPANRGDLTVILLTVFFASCFKLVEFFVSGTIPDSVVGYMVPAADLGAIVILLLPKIVALMIRFLARIWHVMHYVILIEGLVFVFSVIWFKGDGPEIFGFWTNGWNNGLWYLHAWACFQALGHMGYLASGRVPSAGSYDNDSASTFPSDDYGINPSTGLRMISMSVDAGGYTLGEQPTTFDSADSGSSLFDESSSSSSSFDDSSSCVGPFDSEMGSSVGSSSSMFESVSSSSMFDD